MGVAAHPLSGYERLKVLYRTMNEETQEGYGNDNPGAKSQGMKQLMAGGGVALIGTVLVPLLANLFG